MDDKLLKEGERIDDLQRCGLRIIQNKEKFCFGMDAVLLSGFAKAKQGDTVVDFCAGTGIIPILMTAKTEATKFIAVELQEESADMARRSVLLNHLEEKMEVYTGDLRDKILPGKSADVVTVNPPYLRKGSGLINPENAKAIARHEVFCTLEDVLSESSRVLKDQGHFYMVHRPFRLTEIMGVCQKNKLEPKRIRFVHPYVDAEPTMVLIEAVKGAGSGILVEKPMILYTAPGEYTEEIKMDYGF